MQSVRICAGEHDAKFLVDADRCKSAGLRLEKITGEDLPLIRRLGIKDWAGQAFDERRLVDHDEWVVNEDRTVIFKALGGGMSELPEMYDLVYAGEKIRVECGGGGPPAWHSWTMARPAT